MQLTTRINQITNLPLELLRIILSFYTNQVDGLLSFSLVCNGWKKVADSSGFWFSTSFVIDAPRNYLLAQGIRLSLKELRGQSFSLANKGHAEVFQTDFKLCQEFAGVVVTHPAVLEKSTENAERIRNWFIPFLIEQKKSWKFYSTLIPFLVKLDDKIQIYHEYFSHFLTSNILLLSFGIYCFQDSLVVADNGMVELNYWSVLGFGCVVLFLCDWIFQTFTEILHRICIYYFTLRELTIQFPIQPTFFFGLDRFLFQCNLLFVLIAILLKSSIFSSYQNLSWTSCVLFIGSIQFLESCCTIFIKFFRNSQQQKFLLDYLIVIGIHLFIPFSVFLSFYFSANYYDSHSITATVSTSPSSRMVSDQQQDLYSAFLPLIPIFVVLLLSMFILTLHMVSYLTSPYASSKLLGVHFFIFLCYSGFLCWTVYSIASFGMDCRFPSVRREEKENHMNDGVIESSSNALNTKEFYSGSVAYLNNEWNTFQLILIVINNVQIFYLLNLLEEIIRRKGRFGLRHNQFEGLFY